MRIVNKKVDSGTGLPMLTECSNCETELEIEKSDISYGALGIGYIVCPVCGERHYIDGEDITIRPSTILYPTHFIKVNGVAISDDDIQEAVRFVYKVLEESLDDIYHESTSIGDTVVIGLKIAKEIQIYVAKNYYSFYSFREEE